jgi:hypothetical protein
LTVAGATKDLYLFEGNAGLPVFSSSPAEPDFTPAWRVRSVSFTGGPVEGLGSAEAIRTAEAAGMVTVQDTGMVVNYPTVKWPGGELPIDTARDSYLGTGQVIELDLASMTVTFKLHECFNGMRYIVTDTSAPAMAEGMHVAPSPGTAKLVESGAVDNIYVFANGIAGSGVMGFQPAIFRNTLGSASWSPFWDHFTLRWTQGTMPRVLTSEFTVGQAIQGGEVELFNGTPDTHPVGFVVNCPVPVVAANTFSAS